MGSYQSATSNGIHFQWSLLTSLLLFLWSRRHKSNIYLFFLTAFFYGAGQVVIDTSLPFRSNNYSKIWTVSPIAVPASKRAQFSVKGVNLMRPATR